MKKKIFIFSLLSLSLNSCSEFYSYQPPAPVFGRPSATNPYQTDPYQASVEPLEDKTFKPTTEELQSSSKANTAAIVTDDSSRYREPIVKRKASSPAVLALMGEADKRSREGDLESAVVTIERALRIDSRNPLLTYKLAELRLKQSKPRLAEDLAKKAALLSSNDLALKKSSWLLISEARRRQKNYYGAKQAKIKAESL